MGLEAIPNDIRARFLVQDHRHACAILSGDCPVEFADLMTCLRDFALCRSEVIARGGNKSKIAARFDELLGPCGWSEKTTAIEWIIDGRRRQAKTHSIDLCKNRVACEIQWNSKDAVFSRDLATLRLLHDLEIVSVGVIITRGDDLQEIFDTLGWVKNEGRRWQLVGKKYGMSTTHWSKLTARIGNGDAGMCPVLMLGIRKECYRDDIPDVPIRADKPRA